MLLHVLKLLYRNSLRFRLTFIINLAGLSAGLTATTLICLWINGELSVDRFHEDGDRIFQLMENRHTSAGIVTQEAMPIGLAYVLDQELPEVEYAATVTPNAWFPKFQLESGVKIVKAEGRFVGKDYFQIFSFKLLYGEREAIFRDTYSVAISESLSKRLFQSTEPAVGKSIPWMVGDIRRTCVVSGVFKDLPHNSSEQFDILFNIDLLAEIMHFAKDDLEAQGPSTFVKLQNQADVPAFNRKVTELMSRRRNKANAEFFAAPFERKYLYGKFENGVQTGTRIVNLRIFGLVGAIILIVAAINFANLSTAKATVRMKELGMRKTMGAFRHSLIMQFLAESFFVVIVSAIVSIMVVALVLPSFNEITGKEITYEISVETLVLWIAITLFTGIFAATYPAFYLSGFRPADVLKGRIITSFGEVVSRKGLVIFQFVVTTIFIVVMLVARKQMVFLQHKDLGFDKDQVLHFEIEGKVAEDHQAFVERVKQIPGVISASAMIGNIVGSFGTPKDVIIDGNVVAVNQLRVDYGMLEVLKIRLNAGRTFLRDFDDSNKIIISRAAADRAAVNDPIGKLLDFNGQKFEIIGVTENFHYRSLHEEMTPVVFILETTQLSNIFVRLVLGKEQSSVTQLKKLYAEINPGYLFDYRFLDHSYQALYNDERQVSTLSIWCSVLSVAIACSGLFGLAAFSADRRTREIGIRKMLGATSLSIVRLLSAEFAKLIFIAVAIALPMSYWLTREWLNRFAYAVELNTWLFVGGAMTALMLALMTVAGLAWRASVAEPMKSLRE